MQHCQLVRWSEAKLDENGPQALVRRPASHLLLTIAIAATAITLSPAKIHPQNPQKNNVSSVSAVMKTAVDLIQPGTQLPVNVSLIQAQADSMIRILLNMSSASFSAVESDCCGNGTQYNETTISCTSCIEYCSTEDCSIEGETSIDTLLLNRLAWVGPSRRLRRMQAPVFHVV
jgi:hypothetical protein